MLYPWVAYFGLAANIFLAFVQGWTTLSPFVAASFVDAYILLPLFPIIYFTFKFIKKTRFMRSYEIDLVSGRRTDLDSKGMVAEDRALEGDVEKGKPMWKRLGRNF